MLPPTAVQIEDTYEDDETEEVPSVLIVASAVANSVSNVDIRVSASAKLVAVAASLTFVCSDDICSAFTPAASDDTAPSPRLSIDWA